MIFSPFERMVAFRYLRARREEGFVSVITLISLASIVVGVATLIIVMSVLNGFRADIMTQIFGLNGHLAVRAADKGSDTLSGHAAIADRLRRVTGVVRVAPVVTGQAMVSAHGISRGARVQGVSAEQLRTRRVFADNIRAGSLEGFKGRRSVIVGARFARRFNVRPGDSLRLVSPQRDPETMGTLPQVKTYRIAALFHIGMVEYDDGYVFMPLEAAQSQFGVGDGVSQLEVFVADAALADGLIEPVREAAGAPVRVVRWQDVNAALFNALDVERVITFIIVALIILVAAFNIVSGLIMLVKDKGRDIAILRTMGATRGMVMRIFLLSGGSIGFVGTILGFALGILIAANVETIGEWLKALPYYPQIAGEMEFFANLPSRVDAMDVIGVVAMAFGLSFLATLYPAWRAARLEPVEALRYE